MERYNLGGPVLIGDFLRKENKEQLAEEAAILQAGVGPTPLDVELVDNFEHTWKEVTEMVAGWPLDKRRQWLKKIVYKCLITNYSWAVPNQEALEEMRGRKVIEMGAGSGYWAWRLESVAKEVRPYDKAPQWMGDNSWLIRKEWTRVEYGSVETLESSEADTLLLVWPNYFSDFGFDCLDKFKGERVVYVGEGEKGKCGNSKMFEEMNNNWKIVKSINNPQLTDANDHVIILERN